MLGENHYAVEITERARGRRTKVFRQSATTTVRGGHGLITFITYGRTVPPIVDEAALIKDAKPAPPDATEQRTLCARPVFSGANLREPPPAQRMLNLPAAWHFSRGAGQKVAIIDTGVTRHPRLPNLQPGGDHVSNSDGTSDCDSHGTLVAGIVAAQPSTDDAFSGVAPDATILSIRQLSLAYERKDEPGATTTTGYGSVRTLAPAVVRAVNLGATVINIAEVACAPGGTDLSDAALGAAVKYAYDRNVVVVAAAGNVESGSNCRTQNHNPDVSVPGWSTVQTVVSPDWFVPYVLSVASVAPDGSPSHFSLNGPWVGVAAPGEGIVSLDSTPGGRGLVNREQTYNGVSPINGTSFASAYVAGLAALVRSRFPTLTAREVIDRITRTTHATGSGRDERVGSGLIDPLAALTTQLPNRPVDAGANGVQTPAPPVGSQTPAPPVGSQNPLPRWVAIIGVLTCLVVLLIAIARTWVGIRRRWLPPRTPSRFVGGWPRRTRSGSNPTSPYR
ncbi:type VII secretion-associated serine protease mycosin [Nocardia jiangxiensis]|uniref:Type VII secretion-associated serine protease mycosin n=1 Tax=Nocardia jiangxiensis TaxID=282685 RepID=A0ABW6RYW4_9NOCA